MSYKIKIEKDRIKFSSAHFTIFGATEAERLHGHNYYLSIEIQTEGVDSLGFAIDMKPLKDIAYDLSQKLDEYILLPSENPFLKITKSEDQIHCVWNTKKYSFPADDVQILPVTNITCENLAYWFWQEMKPKLPKKIIKLSVSVKETNGQESIYENVI